MSCFLRGLSVLTMVLFCYVMLGKLGVPPVIAGIVAMVAGYILWQFENKEEDDGPGWARGLEALFDFRDIMKYVNKIF